MARKEAIDLLLGKLDIRGGGEKDQKKDSLQIISFIFFHCFISFSCGESFLGTICSPYIPDITISLRLYLYFEQLENLHL